MQIILWSRLGWVFYNPYSPSFGHRNQVIHQGKMPNPMEVILTSQTLICRYQLQIAFYEDQGQRQVSRNHSPQQNRHNERQLLIKVQAIGKEV